MKNYGAVIWKKLLDLKASTVGVCNRCLTTGYIVTGTGIVDCQCMSVFKYLSRLVVARIPMEYWDLSIETLQVKEHYKKMVEYFLSNYKKAIQHSLGILFMGTNGVGKTAMMCEIGKYFVARHYRVLYFTENALIESFRPGSEPIDWLSADVILVDELGKSYSKEGSTFVIDKIEPFLRTVVSSKVVIASTNFNEEGLSDSLGESTISVLKRHLKIAHVIGNDYSEKRQSDWKNLLELNYDYYHENILRMVEIYKENLIDE